MMNWLMPEPACDIRAQIDALLDRRHPKAAVFAAPGNRGDIIRADIPSRFSCTHRRHGTLVVRRHHGRGFKNAMPNEAVMAAILGYPEPKDAAMAACPAPFLRMVQACDWRGNVITEALCSPGWLERTEAALAPHGNIRIMTVDHALGRRFALRCEEAA